jgi:hypothetical protein
MSLVVQLRGDTVVIEAFRRLAADLRQDGLRIVAEAGVKSIYKRTLAGKDEKDGMLKPSLHTTGRRSTTLWDTGGMMTSLRVLSATPERAVIGFPDTKVSSVAWWQHHGTTGPYPIRPRGKKALAFESTGRAGSFSNSVRVGSRKSKKGAQYYSLAKFGGGGRRKVTGMTVVGGVMHPGLPARPFFGFSPTDVRNMQIAGEAFARRVTRGRGL